MQPIPHRTTSYADGHAKRVRGILNLSSAIMVIAGLGWGIYFASVGRTGLVVLDIVMILVGAAIGLLTKLGRTQLAATFLVLGMWSIGGLLCLFQDIPTAAAPRSIHHFFLALGVASYLLFRDAPKWIQHGVVACSMLLFIGFGSSNWGIVTDLALPDNIRVPGTWINNVLAMAILYASVHLTQTDMREHSAIAASILKGVQQRQFVLHFQPQVSADGTIHGAEALVRWNHPSRGLIPPGEFIPEAESSGLIVPLGDWILREACAQLVRWAADPRFSKLSLSVNVSAQQFGQPDFVSRVLQALEESGANAQRLKLELTESMLVSDLSEVIQKMKALRSRGVRLSLDDFGTGFSSLNYLKRLPLDQLKIDKSFVDDVLTNAHDAAIARTVLTLGHSLGLEVIAEGVETQSQCDFLSSLGCKAFQGFLFSKPLPADEFDAFVSDLAAAAHPLSSG